MWVESDNKNTFLETTTQRQLYQQENNSTQRVNLEGFHPICRNTGLGELGVLDLLSPAKLPQTMIGVCVCVFFLY